MKIRRRICANFNKEQIKILNEFGIYFNAGVLECQIIDENESYLKIQSYLDKWEVINWRFVEFSKQEILNSDFNVIVSSFEEGYPMPDDDNGYKELTYNLDNYCESCGIGMIQKSSFRIKKTPNLDKKKVFSLCWINDEFFIAKKLYLEIFEPLGIGYKEVLLYKKETIINDVVQLIIPTVKESLDLSEFDFEICNKCNCKKYNPMAMNFFPIQNNPLPHIYKSKEYFGSGASASKKVFISKELRNNLIYHKAFKHFFFVPAAPS